MDLYRVLVGVEDSYSININQGVKSMSKLFFHLYYFIIFIVFAIEKVLVNYTKHEEDYNKLIENK